jgi:hypothetical protein
MSAQITTPPQVWWKKSTMSIGRVLARLAPPVEARPDPASLSDAPTLDAPTEPRVLPRSPAPAALTAANDAPQLPATQAPVLLRKPAHLILARTAPVAAQAQARAQAQADPLAAAQQAALPVSDQALTSELGRLNAELQRSEARYRELNERYMRNRAAALALGSVYLRIRNELVRLKRDPKQARKLTDPSRLPIIEKTRALIEEHELRALSGGRMSTRDGNPNW